MLLENVPSLANTVTKIVLDEQLDCIRDSGVFEFRANYRYGRDPLVHEIDSDFASYEEEEGVSTARQQRCPARPRFDLLYGPLHGPG
jgi:hypothetical protein